MMEIMLATFVTVFGRAIQQQNVVGGHYVAAAITPYLIAAGEIGVIVGVASVGWSALPAVGTGGAIGAIAAMWTHKKIKQLWEKSESKNSRKKITK